MGRSAPQRCTKLAFAVLAAFAGAGGCAPAPSTAPPASPSSPAAGTVENEPDRSPFHFDDATEALGVSFAYRNGEEGNQAAIPESMGGGTALFDFDADGRLDLFLTGGGTIGPEKHIGGLAPALSRQESDGALADVTQPAGVSAAPFYSHGVAVGDVDGDGFPDLLVTGYGGLLLFQNCGDGTFRETTRSAGLTLESFSMSAAFGDLNGDAVLDLYVANYVNWSFENHPECRSPDGTKRDVCYPRSFEGLPDAVYFGNGDGTFRDATKDAGLQPDGKGLGVLLADLDLDGDLDAYVGNDTTPNFLYQNDGTGRLTEMGILSGSALNDLGMSDGSMGVDAGDFNLDGLPDLWVTNFEMETMGLYRNEGDFTFRHVSRDVGLRAGSLTAIAFGTLFLDADRDGDEDLFVTAGHVNRYPRNDQRKQLPLLFENRDGRRYVDVAGASGDYLAKGHIGRGAAAGDIDNDGDLDLAISHVNAPATVLKNESANAHHWIGLRLIGTRSHRDAVGAAVRVETEKRKQLRLVKGGTSYLSANDPRLFFGLGAADRVDLIAIRWPGGAEQKLTNLAVDRYHTIHEPGFPAD